MLESKNGLKPKVELIKKNWLSNRVQKSKLLSQKTKTGLKTKSTLELKSGRDAKSGLEA